MITKSSEFETVVNSPNLRKVLESRVLAQLGDFLANFIYTSVKIIHFSIPGSVHVWDYSLRNAMDKARLRSLIGKKTKPDRVADAAEAFIAYGYYNQYMTLDEMILIGRNNLKPTDFKSEKSEKEACGYFFGFLLEKIYMLALDNLKIKDNRSTR